ncbi:MAG: response regulator [Haliscomenobacter sp.]|nr:response regulator [Haliscomenobacter sp.]MBK9489433.1 response regulator [Haliscomenobacter sp.]HPH19523.1 response regulator [Haliscomenobacter sp.]
MKTNKTLLIIDDEVDVCTLLRRSFRGEFKTVEAAYLLNDALSLAERIHPDILLLDNNLPDGQGIDFIQRFKSINPFMRIVVISAMDLHSEAIAAGANAFLGKPLKMEAIREAICA